MNCKYDRTDLCLKLLVLYTNSETPNNIGRNPLRLLLSKLSLANGRKKIRFERSSDIIEKIRTMNADKLRITKKVGLKADLIEVSDTTNSNHYAF